MKPQISGDQYQATAYAKHKPVLPGVAPQLSIQHCATLTRIITTACPLIINQNIVWYFFLLVTDLGHGIGLLVGLT